MKNENKIRRYIVAFLFIFFCAFVFINAFRSRYPRIFVQDVYHVYGGFQDSSVVITISVQNDWYQITNDDGDLFNGLETDGFALSGDTLSATFSGDIRGNLSINFEGQVNQEYHFRVYNVTQARVEGFELGDTGRGPNNYAKFAGSLYFEDYTANDKLVLQISNETGTGNATMFHSSFFLSYLHD